MPVPLDSLYIGCGDPSMRVHPSPWCNPFASMASSEEEAVAMFREYFAVELRSSSTEKDVSKQVPKKEKRRKEFTKVARPGMAIGELGAPPFSGWRTPPPGLSRVMSKESWAAPLLKAGAVAHFDPPSATLKWQWTKPDGVQRLNR